MPSSAPSLPENRVVMVILEKKFPASACRKKKISCSTNVIESLWEKNIVPTRLLGKKFLMTRNHPPPPPPPQELNGRPLSTTFIQSTVNTGVRLSQKNTKTYSKIHVLADQRVTIRLVKILFLYGENTILPISVPGLLEKHML